MDSYDKKLKELQTYVPFLTKMIAKLEGAGDKSKEAQLTKMKSLKGILTTPDKKLKLDTLTKCEEVSFNQYSEPTTDRFLNGFWNCRSCTSSTRKWKVFPW